MKYQFFPFPGQWERLVTLSYEERAARILEAWIDSSELHPSRVKHMIMKAYSMFQCKDIAPIMKLNEQVYIQELFHGPTASFKDLALQLMPQIFEEAVSKRHQGYLCFLVCLPSVNMARKQCFLVCLPLVNMARKQCFLVCLPSVNMARKQCFLVCLPSVNMARKQCFLVCLPSVNMARKQCFLVCTSCLGKCFNLSYVGRQKKENIWC